MNCFLSKYYLLEKENLPQWINAQTVESLAQQDIPGIFMAMKLEDVTLTDAQTLAIKDFRTDFAKNYNYTLEWMSQWERDFNKLYGALTNIVSGLAWVTLVPAGVYVVARGELLVWRVRANEQPVYFEMHDAIEPTQIGDIWFITWDKEVAKTTTQTPMSIALDYAKKMAGEQTNKKRFDILIIENQVDINKSNQNTPLKRRVAAINKRLESVELQNKLVPPAVVEPPKNNIPVESKEIEPVLVIPFIDYVAAFFIKKQLVDNQDFICIDFEVAKTSIYKFKIENKRFIYQSEWQFETPKSTRQLISSVEKDKISAALKEIQETLEDADIADFLGENAEFMPLTFGDIKNGMEEWFQKCIQRIDNQLFEHCVLLTDEWLAPILSQQFQKQYPKLTSESHRKSHVYEVGFQLYEDTIYPNLTKEIGIQLQDEKNKSNYLTLLKAGTPYNVFAQANFLPFRTWILLNVPFAPSIWVGHQQFLFKTMELGKQTPTKKMGQYLLADFNWGLSVNGHFEVILHLKNNSKIINNFNIGKL